MRSFGNASSVVEFSLIIYLRDTNVAGCMHVNSHQGNPLGRRTDEGLGPRRLASPRVGEPYYWRPPLIRQPHRLPFAGQPRDPKRIAPAKLRRMPEEKERGSPTLRKLIDDAEHVLHPLLAARKHQDPSNQTDRNS